MGKQLGFLPIYMVAESFRLFSGVFHWITGCKKLSYYNTYVSLMQRVLERCTDEQKGAIMQEILEAFSSLAEDKYGNYVVQVYGWM